MEAYSDAVVGIPGEGLNVEQHKRLTIGVELAAKPQLLLFLDEPYVWSGQTYTKPISRDAPEGRRTTLAIAVLSRASPVDRVVARARVYALRAPKNGLVDTRAAYADTTLGMLSYTLTRHRETTPTREEKTAPMLHPHYKARRSAPTGEDGWDDVPTGDG
ncbi:hypothetical protein BDZ89DRAFT_1131424 [Hymenopellis radicata]|nr:hypothetical protein BDZ89DRAFT_1131424 [Hymenopellis radicata]